MWLYVCPKSSGALRERGLCAGSEGILFIIPTSCRNEPGRWKQVSGLRWSPGRELCILRRVAIFLSKASNQSLFSPWKAVLLFPPSLLWSGVGGGSFSCIFSSSVIRLLFAVLPSQPQMGTAAPLPDAYMPWIILSTFISQARQCSKSISAVANLAIMVDSTMAIKEQRKLALCDLATRFPFKLGSLSLFLSYTH